MNIAVIEDEQKLADSLKSGLEAEGYQVDVFYDGRAAEKFEADHTKYALAILDLMLPHKDGYEICQDLRDHGATLPVLVLTAKDTLEDKIAALDTGADDFMPKPFAFEELLARIRALLRRPREIAPEKISLVDVVLDEGKLEVRRSGKLIPLTLKEYELLHYLMKRLNRVVSRDELFTQVWKLDDLALSNVVDVHIRNLRKKLDDEYDKKIIKTVRGVGYSIQE